MSSLNIFSYNVNGFNDDDKRDEIIRHLYTLRADIQILIDTRLKDKDENKIRNHADIFNYSCVFQNRKDQNSSRGILVLISKNKDIDFETLYKSEDGNFILLKIKYDNRKILIAATYGPNKDNPNFYLRNLRKIENVLSRKIRYIVKSNWIPVKSIYKNHIYSMKGRYEYEYT